MHKNNWLVHNCRETVPKMALCNMKRRSENTTKSFSHFGAALELPGQSGGRGEGGEREEEDGSVKTASKSVSKNVLKAFHQLPVMMWDRLGEQFKKQSALKSIPKLWKNFSDITLEMVWNQTIESYFKKRPTLESLENPLETRRILPQKQFRYSPKNTPNNLCWFFLFKQTFENTRECPSRGKTVITIGKIASELQ